MMDATETTQMEASIREVRHVATERFKNGTNWVSFYREILGYNGLIDRLFPHAELRDQFEQTADYEDIQHLLAKLRDRHGQASQSDEPMRVITVRLPKSLHESLRFEAHHHKTSMNKLCISKLLQVIAGDLVPSDLERREGDEAPSTPADETCVREEPSAAGDATRLDRPLRRLGSEPLPSTDRLHDYGTNDLLTGGRPF